MKNKRIRIAMMQAGINQEKLSQILGIKQSEISVMLKYELAVREQNDIVARIREWSALNVKKGEVS